MFLSVWEHTLTIGNSVVATNADPGPVPPPLIVLQAHQANSVQVMVAGTLKLQLQLFRLELKEHWQQPLGVKFWRWGGHCQTHLAKMVVIWQLRSWF